MNCYYGPMWRMYAMRACVWLFISWDRGREIAGIGSCACVIVANMGSTRVV